MIYDEIELEELELEFPVKSDRRLVRRKRTAHKKRENLKMAKNNKGCFGPYFNEKKGRVVIVGRGNTSKVLKKIAARKARLKNVGICGRANYRRVYDYWWELV